MNFFLEFFKIDKHSHFEKYTKEVKRNILTISLFLVGFSRVTFCTSPSLTGIGTSIRVPVAGCTSFITSVATSISKNIFQNTNSIIKN